MNSPAQTPLKNKTVEDLDLAKYQEGTGESENLVQKHHSKLRSQFSSVG